MKRLRCLAAFPLSIFISFGNANASTLAYQPIVNLSTGTISPGGLAVGDFNADGKPDLAISDENGKTVSVYLNKGGASFGAPVVTTLSIDNTVGSMVSGDFNEDGKADLAVATVAGDQVVIVLLSNGDGTFAVQHPSRERLALSAARSPTSMAMGTRIFFSVIMAHPISFWVRAMGASHRDPLAMAPFPDCTRAFPPATLTAIRSWMVSRQILVETGSAPWMSFPATGTPWEMTLRFNQHRFRILGRSTLRT